MNVAHVATYVRSRSVARWKKVLGVLAVLYTILPVDLVPDVIPIFGWLDDVGFLTALVDGFAWWRAGKTLPGRLRTLAAGRFDSNPSPI